MIVLTSRTVAEMKSIKQSAKPPCGGFTQLYHDVVTTLAQCCAALSQHCDNVLYLLRTDLELLGSAGDSHLIQFLGRRYFDVRNMILYRAKGELL